MTSYEYLKQNDFNNKSLKTKIEMVFYVLDNIPDFGDRIKFINEFQDFIKIVSKMKQVGKDSTQESVYAVMRDEKINEIL